MQNKLGFSVFFVEREGAHGFTGRRRRIRDLPAAFYEVFVRPREARRTLDERVLSEKCDGLLTIASEEVAVLSADAKIDLTRDELHAGLARRPPSHYELRLGPGIEHDRRRRIERARDDELAIRFAFDGRLILGGELTSAFFDLHDSSPFV